MQKLTRDQVLAKSQEICNEVVKQIPLVGNRFEYFDPRRDATPDEEAQLNVEYEQMCLEWDEAEVEYYINEHLTELFKNYLALHHLDRDKLTEVEKETFANIAVNEAITICNQITHVKQVLNEPVTVSLDKVRDKIKQNVADIIKKLQANKLLTISNQSLEQRFQLSARIIQEKTLVENRLIYSNQTTNLLTQVVSDAKDTTKFVLDLQKQELLLCGYYYQSTGCRSGYCGELTALALYKWFDSMVMFKIKKIEVIEVDLLDKDGKKYNNHAFLAINRNANGTLNDPTTWGENAILLDPWTRVVCYAQDLNSQPYKHYCYPTNTHWESQTFTWKDSHLIRDLNTENNHYEITENTDVNKRQEMIFDEYQLTALDYINYPHTSQLLYNLAKNLRPVDFNCEFDLVISTCNDQLITPITGLTKPTIAIHKDFLELIKQGKANLSDLEIGLAIAFYEMKHLGLGGNYSYRVDQFTNIDCEFIDATHQGEALIHYYRSAIEFMKTHGDQNHQINRTFDYKMTRHFSIGYDNQITLLELRIKSIEKILAKSNYENVKTDNSKPHAMVYDELNSLHQRYYFTQQFNQIKQPVDKLIYLTSCLPELKLELMANEINTYMLSRRVLEFIKLLESENFDLNNRAVFSAAHQLMVKAFELKVPGIEKIYIALTKPEKDNYNEVKTKMPALGPFAEYNQLLSKLDQATTFEQAAKSADEFIKLTYSRKLIEHFHKYHSENTAQEYLLDYQKTHNNRCPTGLDRYFGSGIGKNIELITLSPNTIYKLSKWLEEFDDINLAKILFMFKPTLTNALKTLDVDTIYTLLNKLNQLSFDHYEPALYIQLMAYLSQRTRLNTTMFEKEIPFKEALAQYIKENYHLLVTLSYFDKDKAICNYNNQETVYLLKKFVEVIKHGTKEEKQIIKDFFLKKEQPLSLYKLQSRDKSYCNQLRDDSLYVKFILDECLNNETFEFFTIDEKFKFYSSSSLFHGQCDLPVDRYIALCKAPFSELSLPCLEYITNVLIDHDITSYHPVYDIFSAHIQLAQHYTLLTPDTMRLVSLANKVAKMDCTSFNVVSGVLEHIKWNLPHSFSNVSLESFLDLLYLYRTYDSLCAFPSPVEHDRFNKLILNKLEKLTNEDKLSALSLLLMHDDFKRPLSDYQFRTKIILMYVKLITEKYGIDDGSEDYFNKVKPLLDKINSNISNRDKTFLLDKFLTGIQSQQKVSNYLANDIQNIFGNNPLYAHNVVRKEVANKGLGGLAAVSLYFSKDTSDQRQFIEFLSSPLTKTAVENFSSYLISHHKDDELLKIMGYHSNNIINNKENIKFIIINLYQMFWDLPLEYRAFLIDYLLIPADKTISEKSEQEAYTEAFTYVANRLFPNANDIHSDDNFAVDILKSYLNTADKYQKSLLLAGMLVASNETSNSQQQISTGKKLAKLCEHMGPAYIKLAQAIHSHPNTPESIRKDLDHIKGHANPCNRCDIWDLIEKTLPAAIRNKIKHVGPLLGSASYNLALDVTMTDNSHLVLLLLRDNAAKDADNGFTHLRKTITDCKHPRMVNMQATALAMLGEAEDLSHAEMNPDVSSKQFVIAHRVYDPKKFPLHSTNYHYVIKPCHLIANGAGYRLVEKLEGIEFNDLPMITKEEKKLKKDVAKAVLTIELINLLSGSHFDSDRHGNQLRICANGRECILGLFDFGEMSLNAPTEHDIKQFAAAINDLPEILNKTKSFNLAFEAVLTKYVNAQQQGDSAQRYLMRIRKAVLALHDFQKELTNTEMFQLLNEIKNAPSLHPILKKSLTNVLMEVRFLETFQSISKPIFGLFNTVRNKLMSLSQKAGGEVGDHINLKRNRTT